MSSTAAPDCAVHASPNAESQATLRIDLTADSAEDQLSELTPIVGSTPLDEPFWHNHATMPPARGLGPRTMRYKSNRCSIPEQWDHLCKARHAIWDKINEALPNGAAAKALPSIVFDISADPDDHHAGVLDLVFASHEAFEEAYRIMGGLDQIVVAGVHPDDDDAHIYKFECSTNSMPGRIVPFECIRLPSDTLDGSAVLAAFQEIFKSLGSVEGMIRVTVHSQRWSVRGQNVGVWRGYVELAPENMAPPWQEVISQLPTHWVCNGIPYTLRYPGSHLHEEDVFSRDFTIPAPPAPEETDQQSVASSSSKRRAASTTGAQDSSSTAKKKAKRSKK